MRWTKRVARCGRWQIEVSLRNMTAKLRMIFIVAMTFSITAVADTRAGFHWVDFKRENVTVSRVTEILKPEDYTNIREIGIVGDSALVFTTWREPGRGVQQVPLDPAYERWTVYGVSLKQAKFQKLVSGYELQIKAWVHFTSAGIDDLAIVYKDCSECEAASFFTAFHYDEKMRWQARWAAARADYPTGIAFFSTDVPDSDPDADIDQVFAVFAPQNGDAAVGTWYYSREHRTGKVTNDVMKFFVDPASGKERSLTLKGAEAAAWERQLCNAKDASLELRIGQDSKSCKRMLRAEHGAP